MKQAETTSLVLKNTGDIVRRIEATVMQVTPKDAEELLVSCCYTKQRAVRQRYIDNVLVPMMEKGEFHDGSHIAFAEIAGSKQWVLLDGQHRLHAVMRSGRTVSFSVAVYHVATEEDAWKLYYTIDTGLQRTLSEMSSELGEALGTNRAREVKAVTGAIPIIEAAFQRGAGGMEYKYRSKDFRIAQVQKWAESAGLALAVLHDGPEREAYQLLTRSVVLAVVIPTFHWQRERAARFWGEVVRNDALPRVHPGRAMLSYLRGAAAGGRSVAGDTRSVAQCWNQWFTGRSLEKVGVKDPTLPIHIEGTPFRRVPLHGGGWKQALPTDEEFTLHIVGHKRARKAS